MQDPRHIMLFIVFLPYLFWLAGLAGIIIFWSNSMILIISILLLVLGFRFSIIQVKLFHSIYARHFGREIASLDSDNDWLAMDLEILGTEDKLHIFPDDCGIIFKKDNKVFIETIRGRSFVMNPAECVFIFTSKTSLACTITIINSTSGEPVFDYSITPHYKGEESEIPAHSGKKARWFAEWFGCGIESTIDILNASQ
jgi:hypothetical protein